MAVDPLTLEGRREWPLALALAVVAWLLLFFPQLFLSQTFTLGDASSFRPYAEFSRHRWREEQVRTYWNPYTFMGMETVASLADSRPQYLPSPILDWVDTLSGPRFSPQLWLLLTHLSGTLALMLLARRLWRVPGSAALCGGLIWLTAVPILLPFAYGHDAQLVADALIPIQLLLAHGVLVERDRLRRGLAGVALSAALAIQVLHGHPQIAVYAWMFLAAFAVQQAVAHRAPARPALVAASAALALAMAMAVWWPALLYSAQSFRGGAGTPGLSLLEVKTYSLGWRDLASLVWPRAVGYGGDTYWGAMAVTDYSPYLGVVGVGLALLGRKAWSAQRSTAALLGCTLILTMALSLGTTLGPIFGAIRDLVPFWSKFRVPFYVLVLGVLSVALLAARGASHEEVAAPRNRGPLPALALVAAVGVLLGLALTFEPLKGIYAARAVHLKPSLSAASAQAAASAAGLDLVLRVILVAATLFVAWSARRPGRRSLGWVLPLLVAVDLGAVSYPALSRSTGPLSAVSAPARPPLAEVTARDPHARAYVGVSRMIEDRYFEAYTNFWVTWRARCLTGLAGAPPDGWRRAMAHDLVRRGSVLRAWGVTYLDLPAEIAADTASLRQVLERDGIRVYAFRNALGRVYAVPHVFALPDDDAVARAMAHPGFDPRLAALTTTAVVAGEYPGSERATIHWVKDGPEEIVLDVSAPDRAFVVLADSYFPGWTAVIDEHPTAILPANLLVRGIIVPQGRHRVHMRYETSGMRTGRTVTRVGWALWASLVLACGVVALSRRARETPRPIS